MERELFFVSTTSGVFVFDFEEGKTPICHLKDSDGMSIIPIDAASSLFLSPGASKAVLSYWKFLGASNPGSAVKQPFYRVSVPEKLTAIAVSEGGYLFGGSASGTVYLWHLYSGALVRQFAAHFSTITGLILDERGILYTASADGCAKMYALTCILQETSPTPSKVLSGHSLPIVKIGILNQDILVTASDDKQVKLWHAGSPIEGGFTLPSRPRSLAVGVMDLVIGCENGSVVAAKVDEILRGDALGVSEISNAHEGAPVVGVVMNLDGSRWATAASNGIKVWDGLSRQTIRYITTAATDRLPPLGLDACVSRYEAETIPQLKPLQRVLTDFEMVPNVTITRGTLDACRSIYAAEEAEDVQQLRVVADEHPEVAALKSELQKQKDLVQMWAEKYQNAVAKAPEPVVGRSLPSKIVM